VEGEALLVAADLPVLRPLLGPGTADRTIEGAAGNVHPDEIVGAPRALVE